MRVSRIAAALLVATAGVVSVGVVSPASAATQVSVTGLSTNLPFVSPWPQGVGGTPVTFTVELSGPAPDGGAVVKLAKAVLSPGPIYTLDSGTNVTVPAGATQASLTVPTLPTSSFIVEQLIATTSFSTTTTFGIATTAVAFTPPAAGAPARTEAESGRLSGSAAVQTTLIGGVAGKSVAFTGSSAQAAFTVNSSAAGARTLVLNYATPRSTSKKSDTAPRITVTANGSSQTVTLRLTPGSTSYAWAPVTIATVSGQNSLTIASADGKAVNLDWLELS